MLMKMMQVSTFIIDFLIFLGKKKHNKIYLGVKRPSELSQTQNVDDGNSNTKNNQSSRVHPNDRRSDFRYDGEYNPK